MISWLRGEILEREGPFLTVAANGSNAGVGYQVMIPDRPSYLDRQPGTTATFHIYTHVREDALDLFGFGTREEKRLFLMLLSVSGIGPKGALSVLTGLSSSDLVAAILSKDLVALTATPGIGKKTAERIFLELSDAVRKRVDSGECVRPGSTGRPGTPVQANARSGLGPAAQAARQALLGLGFKEAQADQMLDRAISTRPEPAERAEDLVRDALRGGHA